MLEQEEVGWCKIMRVGLGGEAPQTIFSTEIPAFLRDVNRRIIPMETELSLLPCCAQRDADCKDIVTVAPLCKTAMFWKRVEQVESE
jgi:hypothetical protein